MKKIIVPLALSPGSLAVHAASARIDQLNGSTMGTDWSVKFVDGGDVSRHDIAQGIQAELDRVVAQMSTWDPESDLSRFNAAPAGTWHALPPDFFTVLDYALVLAGHSGGAYDPTVGHLVDLWGFGPAGAVACAPDQSSIHAARERGGWRRLELDRTGKRVLQPGGVYVDLSGIAKGHGVDAVARWLARSGVASFLVEVGGELRGYGAKPDGQPWWVELEQPLPVGIHPETQSGTQLQQVSEALVALHGLAVATSGDYRRFFDGDGRRYSHTIDPRTGYPIPDALASVTVLHPECMVADALATALTVLGAEEGYAWASRRGLSARFVSRSNEGCTETFTPALAAMME